ncbi:thioredoxin domain-containing protein [Flavilitoribacter nigricans]|uniref:Thioredoxin domain-containing protein n=1 Tax=Flavilitoribacter nigricans (strain ATCC 23147 / DSM 23189 / NBRC 102662 / NCIMB 1420 / SS-2) TaxID=1122177 RepID=A0A2D0NGI7_FLAN2|nr:thioredoxin domain-containing protein [Flavilitoribacter nigricans]PHN07587.1 thioredoxin domain-containing protein [Flavilitoribacter nigricans DSM 23189 = NBRC 102662]
MKYTLNLLLLSAFSLLFTCNPPEGQEEQQHAYTNQLIHTNSPYLLQHAHNPVNWYPWGEEALEKAASEDKMLLISVGYAACHWCHVMEHESFEDTTVARIMNEHFVSIKVDREERPDIDAIYMTACQMASNGSCGWPLNAFALPDGRPVWAGTYFPRKQWVEILEYFVKLREDSPEKLNGYADQLTEGLRALEEIDPVKTDSNFPAEAAAAPVAQFLENFDQKHGGRTGIQKFPMPNNYEWLLQYAVRTGDPDALAAVRLTLDKMGGGGIYDQLGGGFARYATDAKWQVPHFEKMLYDNAQLVSLYAKAYQATGSRFYRTILEETLSFIERELTDPSGGFYSSLDADSEGEEGKFYVWSQSEIDSLLSPEEASLISTYYHTSKRGNWEEGKNILRTTDSLSVVARKMGLSETVAGERLAAAEAKLLDARSGRVRPGLDDKILTGWNALMLIGLTDAYRAVGTEAYRSAAIKNGNFLAENMMQEDGRLDRNYKDGNTAINAFLDDYALTIQAFLKLYEITFDEQWLEKATRLADYSISHFRDETSGFFFYTSDLDPPLLVRKIQLEDNVIPSSNSIMARALLQLGHYYYEPPYREIARNMMNGMRPNALEGEQASYYSNWNQLYLELSSPIYEVAIVGPDHDALRRSMQTEFHPEAIYLGGATEGELDLLEGKLSDGETFIYVCLNKVCKLPVQDAGSARELLAQ